MFNAEGSDRPFEKVEECDHFCFPTMECLPSEETWNSFSSGNVLHLFWNIELLLPTLPFITTPCPCWYSESKSVKCSSIKQKCKSFLSSFIHLSSFFFLSPSLPPSLPSFPPYSPSCHLSPFSSFFPWICDLVKSMHRCAWSHAYI